MDLTTDAAMSSKFLIMPAALMKEEATDVEFIQKRRAPLAADAEPELNSNTRVYTCDNTQCPHSDHALGFLDRNARNGHQYACRYNNNAAVQPSVAESKTPAFFPTPYNPQSRALGGFDFGLPVDGQRCLAGLMTMYETGVAARSSLSSDAFTPPSMQMGGTLLSPCSLGGGNTLMQQQQQSAAFFIRHDDAPFGGDITVGAPEFSRFSSGFDVSAGGTVGYAGAMQQPPQKHVGSNWFY